MTYVPGIENDVFISFARGETVPDIDRQWVSRFVSDLELELGRLPGGAELKIFFDETVPRNNYFGVVIPNLQRSALFVAIISPEVASERQLIEFEAFADMPNAKGRIIFIETSLQNILILAHVKVFYPSNSGHYTRAPSVALNRASGLADHDTSRMSPQRFRNVSLTRGNVAPIFANRTSPAETRLVELGGPTQCRMVWVAPLLGAAPVEAARGAGAYERAQRGAGATDGD